MNTTTHRSTTVRLASLLVNNKASFTRTRDWQSRLTLLLCLAGAAGAAPRWSVAAEYQVTPNGSAMPKGTHKQPYDLATALAGAPDARGNRRIRPGDTLWLAEGVYPAPFVVTLQGSAARPITICARPGQRAIIDCRSRDGAKEANFTVHGSYLVFRELEFTCSDPKRETQDNSPWPTDVKRGSLICDGPHNKFINLIVHDLGTGICLWTPAEEMEVYGCLIFHNGWKAPVRGHGHAIYAQNKRGVKRLIDNVLFQQFGYGIHCYGTGDASLEGFEIEGNASFQNGRLTRSDYQSPAIYVGGGAAVAQTRIHQNYTFEGSLQVGALGIPGRDVSITENVIHGYTMVRDFERVVFRGNTVIGSDTIAGIELKLRQTPDYDWDGNRYYRLTGKYPPFGYVADNRSEGFTLDEWRQKTGLDAASKLTSDQPAGVQTFVRPNRYDRGRAHVIVYNGSGQDEVEVDLARVLDAGQRFRIRSVTSPFEGSLVEGEFHGDPIAVPMKPIESFKPVGMSDWEPVANRPYFDVLLVLPLGNRKS